jgi:ribose transport system ATP-binding protein
VAESALVLSGISKSFAGVEVLHGVDFDVRPGEVHALVGENGAGKSTLMKIAAGVHQADSGRITIGGLDHAPRNPSEALRAGIAMVHQELSLAPDLSVAENIFATNLPLKGRFVDWTELAARASALLSDFCLAIDPMEPVSSFGIGYRQVMEILKALAANPKIVIFDEPTSSLESSETALVLDTITQLSKRSIGVVYITHRLDEVFKVADRITVLRDGDRVWTKQANEVGRDDVVAAMVGRGLEDSARGEQCDAGHELLRVKGLTRKGSFSNVSFAVNCGEIVGFSGLVGAGRTEVMRAVFGIDRSDSGEVFVGGRQARIRSVKDAMDVGIAYLPEDRKALGLFLDRSVEDNIVCASLEECSRHGVVRQETSATLSSEYCARLAIKSRGIDQEVGTLSGGNQQKVLLAKWLLRKPKVLIVDEPTRGVDVGARVDIHNLMRELARVGTAVIVISSDMTEIIALSDRVCVMAEGRITGELGGDEISEEAVMRLATQR